MQFAYATISVKSFDDEQRIIEGIASTPATDRVGDIVEPLGATFKLPMPLLWQHRSSEPIGHVIAAQAMPDGIAFKAQLANVPEPGKLKDRIDEAWQSIKHKLVQGVSIGFKSLESEPVNSKQPYGPERFLKWAWLELSAVTIPANQEATINVIRSIDQRLRAESGKDAQKIEPTESGHKAKPAAVAVQSLKLESKAMPMTNTERMKGLEEKRAAEMGAIESIQSKVTDENRTKDESEQESFDGHAATIKSIDRELADCRMIERELVAKAKPPAISNEDLGTALDMRSPVMQVSAPKLPPGIGFVKMLECQAYARENHRDVIQVARQFCGQWPQIENALRAKAAVAVGTTTGTTWASPLVYAQNLTQEFIDFLMPQSFLPRLVGLRHVPFNVRIPRETAALTAGWVGEGRAKAVRAGAYDSVSLTFAKIALICGVTQELARFSSPSVEVLIRDDLAEAIAKYQDEQFITPSVTALAGVHPASITNGADSDAASGTASTDLDHDLRQIMKHFQDYNISGNITLLMTEQLATAIGMMRSTLSVLIWPTVSAQGGNVAGMQVITSNNVPSGYIVAIHTPSVAIADEGGLEITASTEASIELDDSPTSSDYHLVSAFQNNLLLLRAERFITWTRLRDKGVFYLTNCAYGGAVT